MTTHAPGMFGKPKKKSDPPPTPAEKRELTEAEQLLAWRYLMLLDLGFVPDEAYTLIRNPRLNWHDAERLIQKGCPRDLAIRILEE